MKGVCLFGGTGKRLGRYTRRVANKHLILIGDKTIADLTVDKMVEANITHCCLVTGSNYAGQIVTYFGDGKEWGLEEIDYKFQYNPDGIPSGFLVAENYCRDSKVFLHLGDNVIDYNFKKDCDEFREKGKGCQIYLKKVDRPENFGVAEITNGCLISLEEKPARPKSDLAVIGAYLLDQTALDRTKCLKRSARGETEVMDLIRSYLENSDVNFKVLDCFYSDVGTPQEIARVSKWYYEKTWGKFLS